MRDIEKFFINKIEDLKEIIFNELVDFFGHEYEDFIKERIINTQIYIHHPRYYKENIDNLKNSSNIYQIRDIDEFNTALQIAYTKSKIIENINNKQSIYQDIIEKYFPTYKRKDFPRSFIEGTKVLFAPTKIKDRIKAKSIEKRKVEIYKALGVDLGDDYQNYINHPEVKKLKINRKLVTDFLDEIDKVSNIYYRIYDEFGNNYETMIRKLKEAGYKTNHISNENKKNSYCFFNEKDGKITPICCYELDDLMLGKDDIVIHELIHAATMISKDKVGVSYRGQNYYINEAITEALTSIIYQKITNNNDILLFNKPYNKDQSVYFRSVDIGKSFIKKFRSQLGELLFNDIEAAYQIIDEKTFMNLNEVCAKIILVDYMPEASYKGPIQEGLKIIENYKINKLIKK